MRDLSPHHDQIFDHFAHSYETCLNSSLRVFGETVRGFAFLKAAYLSQFFDDLGSPPRSILEIGCGVGLLTETLAKVFHKGTTVVGYDPSAESIRLARTAIAGDNVSFFSKPDELTQRAFEAVVLANVLHHIPPSKRILFLKETSRWIRPGGYLAIFEHNPYNPVTRWIVRHCPFDVDADIFSRRRCAQLLRETGWQVARKDYVVFFPAFLKFFRPLERYLKWLPLGGQYAIIARKD
ncbi:MAG: class I SAM-dependent methyltransferase [Elusimicrobia bacterium]|nr:class I SAM-dependent methyltransferase [Elusimicrobiota bacterium]